MPENLLKTLKVKQNKKGHHLTAKDKRAYERHDLDIPIVIDLGAVVHNKREYLNDISIGGLSFKSALRVHKGAFIHIKIPLVKPVFEAKGKVVWCRKAGVYYNVGVKFMHIADAFRLRMVEQICHIEKYKKEICARKGKEITGEEAALEWIKRYAKYFPQYRKSKKKPAGKK
jgi:hypothetical protein